MITKLGKNNEVTLLEENVPKLRLSEGDQFEIILENNIIKLEPVAAYPETYIKELTDELETMSTAGKFSTFNSIDEMFEYLDK